MNVSRKVRVLFAVLACTALLVTGVRAGERKPVAPSAKDKCPVCGMFVKKYPDWTSQIIFTNGSYVVFDGAKDLFKYYLHAKRYKSGFRSSEIDSIYVTDYYDLRPIDAREAVFVIGSDVYGPMGRELIPFGKKDDARAFMKDHKGKAMLNFRDVTPDRLKELD